MTLQHCIKRNNNVISTLKPMDREKGTSTKSKLFELLVRDLTDECVEAQIES